MSYDVWGDGPQPEDDGIEDCGAPGGRWHDCTLAGTEFCDFDCPFGRAAQMRRAARLAADDPQP